jgi:hypothetical protein
VRIKRKDGCITLRDRAGPHWWLGLFLLIGGLIAIVAPFGLASDAERLQPLEQAASVAIGLGVCAGALWWLHRSPATRVILDLGRRRIRLERSGITGRRVLEFGFDEVGKVLIERGKDTDGDPITRPTAYLRNGETVHLSLLWSHDQAAVHAAAVEVALACGVPAPRGT